MKKITRLALGLTLSFGLVGCITFSSTTTTTTDIDSASMTGADRDSHDCIASAGYTWSEVLGKCIRIFEAGIRLTSPSTPGYAAYAVFAVDSSRVELFCPGGDIEILDRRTLPDGSSAWNVEDDDTKNLRKIQGAWVVDQRAKVIFYSE